MSGHHLPHSLLPQTTELVLGVQQRGKCLSNSDSVQGEVTWAAGSVTSPWDAQMTKVAVCPSLCCVESERWQTHPPTGLTLSSQCWNGGELTFDQGELEGQYSFLCGQVSIYMIRRRWKITRILAYHKDRKSTYVKRCSRGFFIPRGCTTTRPHA